MNDEQRAALAEFTTVPMICHGCGAASDLPCFDDQTREAVFEAACRDSVRDDLEKLRRADRLFKRFPNSRHALKVAKVQLGTHSAPCVSDPEFERALAAERGLYAFLTQADFYLPASLARTEEVVAAIEQSPEPKRFACPVCGFTPLRLESEFFKHLCWQGPGW